MQPTVGSTIAHTAERIGTSQRTQDRLDWERTFTPQQDAEYQRLLREKVKADRAAKRLADQLAKEAQDKIDIANKVLIIQEDGYRFRKNPITNKWEHSVGLNKVSSIGGEMEKSSFQIFQEQQRREYEAALAKTKRPPTQAERDAAKKRFEAITAQNELDKQLEQDSIFAQREREVSEEIAAALKDVATPDEVAEVGRRAAPLLKRFVTSLSDFQITEWCNHTVEAIRNEKAARELTGL